MQALLKSVFVFRNFAGEKNPLFITFVPSYYEGTLVVFTNNTANCILVCEIFEETERVTKLIPFAS